MIAARPLIKPSLRWSAFDDFMPEEGSTEHLRIVHAIKGHARGIHFDIGVQQHFIHQDEIDAIERSGRCSWQEYAAEPTPYTQPVHGAWQHINDRPGATPRVAPIDELESNCQRWTYAEEQLMISMRASGKGVADIALVLRRSIRAVYERCWEMGRDTSMDRKS